jgi:hypothetical protein
VLFVPGCALEKASLDRPRKVLVFINPFGGKGLAQSIFNNNVAPLFRLAGLKYEVSQDFDAKSTCLSNFL